MAASGTTPDNSSHKYATIDIHTHFTPAAAPLMRHLMDANRIQRVVNAGTLVPQGIPFDKGMAAFRRVLGDRCAYFATPDFSDTSPGFGQRFADDLAEKVARGACGLKIFKQLGLTHRDHKGRLIAVDDPRLDPLWARCGELGVPVLIHTADPVAFFEPLDEGNERREELARHPDWHFGRPGFPNHDVLLAQRDRVLKRHPATIFLGAHLGNYPENLNYVDACLDRYPNFYVDTSARIGEIGRHPAQAVRDFFIKHQDRILFGTDTVLGQDSDASNADTNALVERVHTRLQRHWRFFETHARQIEYPGYPGQGRWKVDALNLPAAVLRKLYTENARHLVPGWE